MNRGPFSFLIVCDLKGVSNQRLSTFHTGLSDPHGDDGLALGHPLPDLFVEIEAHSRVDRLAGMLTASTQNECSLADLQRIAACNGAIGGRAYDSIFTPRRPNKKFPNFEQPQNFIEVSCTS